MLVQTPPSTVDMIRNAMDDLLRSTRTFEDTLAADAPDLDLIGIAQSLHKQGKRTTVQLRLLPDSDDVLVQVLGLVQGYLQATEYEYRTQVLSVLEQLIDAKRFKEFASGQINDDARREILKGLEDLVSKRNAMDAALDSTAGQLSAARSKPIGLHGEPGDGKVTVSWSAPAVNGSGAIKDYTVSCDPPDAQAKNVKATTAVLKLNNGVLYTISVVANFDSGNSSDPATVSVTPAKAARAPQNLQIETGGPDPIISWSPPLDSGGGTIQNYTVTCMPPDCNEQTVTSTKAMLTGLQRTITYTVSVAARTAVGLGAAAQIPVTVPLFGGDEGSAEIISRLRAASDAIASQPGLQYAGAIDYLQNDAVAALTLLNDGDTTLDNDTIKALAQDWQAITQALAQIQPPNAVDAQRQSVAQVLHIHDLLEACYALLADNLTARGPLEMVESL